MATLWLTFQKCALPVLARPATRPTLDHSGIPRLATFANGIRILDPMSRLLREISEQEQSVLKSQSIRPRTPVRLCLTPRANSRVPFRQRR